MGYSRKTSRYIGVSKRGTSWIVSGRDPGSRSKIFWGCYSDEKDAARARDFYALQRFGASAKLNFPDDVPTEAWVLDKRRRQKKTSQYIGVFWRSSNRRWVAQVRDPESGLQRGVGAFTDENEAARVHDRWARLLHGDDAQLNFPEDSGSR